MSKFSRKLFDINQQLWSSISYPNSLHISARTPVSKAGVKRAPQKNSVYQPGRRQDGEAMGVSADLQDSVPAAVHSDIADKSGTAAPGMSPEAAQAGRVKKDDRIGTAAPAVFDMDFSEEGLIKGIILSEILGRPKCFRNGR